MTPSGDEITHLLVSIAAFFLIRFFVFRPRFLFRIFFYFRSCKCRDIPPPPPPGDEITHPRVSITDISSSAIPIK